MAYTIYDKNGNERLALIEESLQPNAGRFVEPQLEYNGTWMGECFVTLNIKSPVPIDFAIGDYVMYRGEKFVINYDPSVIKKATKKSTGDAFCYDNVKFSALSYELSDIRMLDYVIDGNNLHWNGLPKFSVFCATIDDFADWLQANADRWCEENGIGSYNKWLFITPNYLRSVSRAGSGTNVNSIYTDAFSAGTDTDDELTNQNVSIDNMSVWDSMKYIKETFGLNFIVRGRSVIIGAAGISVGNLFKYGKNNGLYEIERVADSEQQIVTKLFAYGSDRNLPVRYYADISDGLLPNNLAVNVLMLPGFPSQSLYEWVKVNGGSGYEEIDANVGVATWRGYTALFSRDPYQPFVMSTNALELGIREAAKYFDGSDGTDEIYPSITAFGTNTVYSVDVIEDAGVYEAGVEVDDFKIVLTGFGADDFNLNELITSDSAISMLDGTCGGRDFPIVSAVKNDDGRWEVTCHRVHDDALDLWFPYSDGVAHGGTASANEPYQIQTGDSYVFVGIEMPSSYVEAASVKLLEGALRFLSKNDTTRYTYVPKIDEIYMAREAVEAESANPPRVSIHDRIKEGDLLVFEDSDLQIETGVFIDTIRIKEYGNQQIPTYDVTLRNEKQVGTIQRIQEQLGRITSGDGAGMIGNASIPMLKSLIKTYGNDMFLSRLYSDDAAGVIRFLKGLLFGKQGHGITEDGIATLDAVKSLNFQTGDFAGSGFGMYLDENGISSLEIDKLMVRMKAIFQELEIKKKSFSAGDLGFSDAANKLLLVLPLDGNGEVIDDVYTAVAFRCCWLMKDGEEAVDNDWHVDDQARCQTFNIKPGVYRNVSNRYYWRKVLEVGEDFEWEGNSFNYIDLAANETGTYKGNAFTKGCQAGVLNDVPAAQDEVIQLGSQTDTDRQNYTEIIVNGNDAPAIKQYQGINDYTLSEKMVRGDYYDPVKHTYRCVVYGDFYAGDKQRTGGYAEYDKETNTFNIKGKLEVGSTLEDGREVNDIGLRKGNLLRNSGFTGQYESEAVASATNVANNTVIYSDPFDQWEYTGCTAVADANSMSGMAAIIGELKQTIEGGMTVGDWYTFSFRGQCGKVTLDVGGVVKVFELSQELERYDYSFVCLANNPFILLGTNSKVMELQLMVGNIPSEWHSSHKDNDRAFAEYHADEYLRNAIAEASTIINGGLILSQILKVGNYRNKQMIEETGGMSGAYTDDRSPFLWGGGTMEQAIYTIMKYANNPKYQPTENEVAQMAKFVVTHGGRAILNDIILRGYIYALGGVFNGTIYADKGVFNGIVTTEFKDIDNADGTLVYIPDPGGYIFDSFRYTMGREDLSIMYAMPATVSQRTPTIAGEFILPTTPYYVGKTVNILCTGTAHFENDFLDAVKVKVDGTYGSSYIFGIEQYDGEVSGQPVKFYATDEITFDGGVLSLVGTPYGDYTTVNGVRQRVVTGTIWVVRSFTYRLKRYGTNGLYITPSQSEQNE